MALLHSIIINEKKKKIIQFKQAIDDYDIEEDLPNALKLLGEMNNNVKVVSDLVESMLQKVKNGELSTEYGLSFLEIKYHMLLTYLINLTYVVLRKCSGVYELRSMIVNYILYMCGLISNHFYHFYRKTN